MLSECKVSVYVPSTVVSILVVMEYALGAAKGLQYTPEGSSLNPCCNGICSRSMRELSTLFGGASLNPCCNGICSRRGRMDLFIPVFLQVSILVVMEYALGAVSNKGGTPRLKEVSILVVMEYALGGPKRTHCYKWRSLNPCCNGICSRRVKFKSGKAHTSVSLNPCCNGICSRSLTAIEKMNTPWTGLNPCCNGICSRRVRNEFISQAYRLSQSLL